MKKTLKEIAAFVNGSLVGDGSIVISGVAGIDEAGPGDITFLANPRYLPYLEKTKASAVVTDRTVTAVAKPIIRTDNPSLAFVKIVSFLFPTESTHPEGIHPTAIVAASASLGKNVALGPYAVVEADAVIGDNSVIYAHSFVGRGTKIGREAIIYPNVSIREQVSIGDRVIIHSGTVIGSDGFGFITVDGAHHKIPQVGTVVIEDDVEIGANTAIDRARFDKTVIGKGTKIDNLVHIAHNVEIGQNCFIVAQVGISGSTRIGNNVILAGQVGVVGHIEIGDNCVVMAQSGVSKSMPPGTVAWGFPAKPAALSKRINASVQNLPRLYESVAELKKKVEGLSAAPTEKKEKD